MEVDGTLLVPQPKPIAFPCAAPAAGVRIVAVSCGSRHTLALDAQVRECRECVFVCVCVCVFVKTGGVCLRP